MRALTAFAAALLVGLSALAARAEAGFGPLIAPDALAETQARAQAPEAPQAGPLILDIRGDAYNAGHIPGAVGVAYSAFRGPAENPGRLPDDAALTELFQRLGLSRERPVVIVHQGADATDFGAAARVYWTLKSAGIERLAILNGGMNAWTAEGARPVSDRPVEPAPSDMEVALSHRWLATQADIEAIVEDERGGEGGGGPRLVDARPAAFFEGEAAHPAAARPGTLPQAEYFTHSGWFEDGPAIVEPEAARRLARENGFAPGDSLVSFCNTGHWAATNWFALHELAGIEDVKLYAESMVGWSNAGLAMQNVPGLLETFWSQIKASF